MSSYFNKLLNTVVQSTGANTSLLVTASDRASFQINVKADIARLVAQHNLVLYPILSSLRSGPTYDDVVEYGIEGRTVTTFGAATSGSAPCYWNATLKAPASIKETIDYLITEISRLENFIAAFKATTAYDDSSILGTIYCLQFNDNQIVLDTFGSDYSLDCDGTTDLSYPLARHIYEIGTQLINGFPSMGLSFTGTYPALSFDVLLSQITIDTTLPNTVITGLPVNLAAIAAFTGMDNLNDFTPDYSPYGGPLNWIADGMPLEEAIASLDQSLEVVTAVNVGAGAQVYQTKTASQFSFRTLTSTSGLISLTQNPNEVDLDLNAGINDLTDVTIAAPTNGQYLRYDTATSQWINAAGSNLGGSDWVEPSQCIAPVAAPVNLRDPGPPILPIVVNYYDYPGATEAEELSFRYLEFAGGDPIPPDAQRIMWTLGVPNIPPVTLTKCRTLAYFVLPNTWAAGAGGTATFDLQIGESTTPGSYGVIKDGSQIIHAGNTWGAQVAKTMTVPAATPGLTLYVLDFGTLTFNPTGDGVVNFRLKLDAVTVPTGEFVSNSAEIWFVGAEVVWLQ